MSQFLLKKSFRRRLISRWNNARQLDKTAAVICAAVFVLFAGMNFSYLATHLEYVVRENGTPPVSAVITGSTTTTAQGELNFLSIPRLRIEAPIREVTEKSEKAYQSALEQGVVHYPGTAKPGEAGNAYIFGHSSDYSWSPGKYKSIFALLTKIRTGDLIYASDESGVIFTYRVLRTKIVSPRDLSVLDQGEYKQKLLTLQTSYPLGTALKRFIVVSELVE